MGSASLVAAHRGSALARAIGNVNPLKRVRNILAEAVLDRDVMRDLLMRTGTKREADALSARMNAWLVNLLPPEDEEAQDGPSERVPSHARMYIMEMQGSRDLVSGVSPDFAMTKMDDEKYPECDIYVEDHAAAVLLGELLAYHGKDVFSRCSIIPFGTANVGRALGQMVHHGRFHRPSRVFLDGDNSDSDGCILLPGGDAPERVVFRSLANARWGDVCFKIQRDTSEVTDACSRAMTLNDHHEWVRSAANSLICSGDTLWQSMCSEWAKKLPSHEADTIVNPIRDALP